MKHCPKCKKEHSKKGTYCSRSCGNSRTWSEETNKSRSAKLLGRTVDSGQRKRVQDTEKWKANISDAWLKKYQSTPFEELGMENRRRRVFEEQDHCCNKCGLSEWLGFPIALELEHKDGNNQNNQRENLEGLCPNCHSLTETWRGRNKPARNGDVQLSDEELLEYLKKAKNIRQGLLSAGLAAKGNNYNRAKRLLGL